MKHKYRIFPLLSIAVLSLILVSCNSPRRAPVIDSFAASEATIMAGDSIELSWSITGATRAEITPSVGNVSFTSGTETVTPAETTTYLLQASNSHGTDSSEVTVNVDSPVEPVVTEVTVSPGDTIEIGATYQFTENVVGSGAYDESVMWSSSNTAVATIDADGLATGHSAGVTLITATSRQTPSAIGSAELTVAATRAEMDFGTRVDVEPSSPQLSDIVVVSSLGTAVPATISGDGSPELLHNGNVTSVPVEVATGDTLQVRLTASSMFGAEATATVTIAGVSSNFTVTTRAGVPASIALSTDLPDPRNVAPGDDFELSWTVSGDYEKLEMTRSDDGSRVDVTGLSSESISTPSNAAEVIFTLIATHPQLAEQSQYTSITVPLWVCEIPTEVITFADSKLEQRIRGMMSMPDTDITCADAQGFEVFDAENFDEEPGEIESLVGMQHFSNLKKLLAGWNNISDLTPLAGLTKLTNLELDKNLVTDLTPIAGLTMLEVVSFWDNGPVREEDVDANAGVEVYCYDGIDDIRPLADLSKLKEVYLSCNNISNISALEGKRDLELAFLLTNKITDITPLSDSASLKILRVGDNRVSADSGVFVQLADLIWLDISWNSFKDSDLSGLAALDHLYALELEGNYFTNLDPVIDNSSFPASTSPGFGIDAPMISIGYNCLGDPTAVSSVVPALQAKSTDLRISGETSIQRQEEECAGPPSTSSLSPIFQQQLQQYRDTIRRR